MRPVDDLEVVYLWVDGLCAMEGLKPAAGSPENWSEVLPD